MADWATFAGFVAVVCLLLLALSNLTERALTPTSESDAGSNATTSVQNTAARSTASEPTADWVSVESTGARRTTNGRSFGRSIRASRVPRPHDTCGSSPDTGSSDLDTGSSDQVPEAPLDRDAGSEPFPRSTSYSRAAQAASAGSTGQERRSDVTAHIDGRSVSTGALLANVALTQGLFAALVVGAAIYTEIPAEAFGIEFTREYLFVGLAIGTAAGLVLYTANEVGAALAKRTGIDHSDELREMLAPETVRGWLVLLLAVLPLIALFEELLFRAALIGVLWTGFGVSPWLLAVVSSIAFALGHGIQGTAGIVVTGLLGFVLAALFIWSGSLLVVVVAHYLINAFEFVVHEGFEIEWTEAVAG